MSDVLETIHGEVVLLPAACTGVSHGPLALRVVPLDDLGIGVAEFDGKVGLQYILEPNVK